jgi:hypothetical protein
MQVLIDSIKLIGNHFYLSWFMLVVFVFGFICSAIVEKLEFLSYLKIFPKWFLKISLRFVGPEKKFWQVFLFIALFNSTAILLYMMSGMFIVLPILIAFMTGLNIGIITQEPMSEEVEGKHPFRRQPVRPGLVSILGAGLVPLLELSVFCFSMGMGMSLGMGSLANYSPIRLAVLLAPRVMAYLIIGVPILIISAALEAGAIKDLQRLEK